LTNPSTNRQDIAEHISLYGADNIVDRSIVLHKTGGDRWACASILLGPQMSSSTTEDVNCVGEWLRCGAACAPKVYSVTVPAAGTGSACSALDGATTPCFAGEGDCPEPPPPPPANSVVASLSLNTDLATIQEGTEERRLFEEQFKGDVAGLVGVGVDRIVVTSIAAGSIVVDFLILPDGSVAFSTAALETVFGVPGVVVAGGTTTTPVHGVVVVASPAAVGTLPQSSTGADASGDEDESWVSTYTVLLTVVVVLVCVVIGVGFALVKLNATVGQQRELITVNNEQLARGLGTIDKDEIAEIEASQGGKAIEVDDDMRRLFESVDKDGSGTLSRDEITALMSTCGIAVDPTFVEAALDAYDKDRSGQLELPEFAMVYKVLQRRAQEKEDLRQGWEVGAKDWNPAADGGGGIDTAEIAAVAKEQVDMEVSPQIRRLFASVDTDGSGSLSREEVALLMSREGLKVEPDYLTAALDAYDLDQSGELDLKEFALVHLMLTRRAKETAVKRGKRLPPSLAALRPRSTTPERSWPVGGGGGGAPGSPQTPPSLNPLQAPAAAMP
jgi:Ca2+-binding EF-hand superfamily protein